MTGNLDAAVLARLRLCAAEGSVTGEAVLRRAMRVSIAELGAALDRLRAAGQVELAGLGAGRRALDAPTRAAPVIAIHAYESETPMSVLTPATEAFDALVARYEQHGWVVRVMDHDAMRAIVRVAAAASTDAAASTIKAPTHLPACRKLWIDAEGRANETDVPC
jgi:hypothetical protein